MVPIVPFSPTFTVDQLSVLDACRVTVSNLKPISVVSVPGIAWYDDSPTTMGRLVVRKDDMPNTGQFLTALGARRAELLGKLHGVSVYAVDASLLLR